MMPPFGGFPVVKSRRNRKRKSRKEDTGNRINLPDIPDLSREDIPDEPTTFDPPRVSAPTPSPVLQQIADVHGSIIYPSDCDEGVNPIPVLGDFNGTIIPPVHVELPIPSIMNVMGTIIPPSVCELIRTFDVDDFVRVHEEEEGRIDFRFPGSQPFGSRIIVSWYASETDAEARNNPLPNDERPMDVEIHTDRSLTTPGYHEGYVLFTPRDVDMTESIFGRVEIQKGQIYGTGVYPTLPDVYPTPPMPPTPLPPGTVIPPADCGIIHFPILPEIYGSTIYPSDC